MKILAGFLLMVAWSAICFAETLTPEQIRLLIENMTVEGADLRSQHTAGFRRFFSPDGSVIERRAGDEHTGRWWINDKGQHCVQWSTEKTPHCHFIEKEEKGFRKYSWSPDRKKKFVIRYDGYTFGDQR